MPIFKTIYFSPHYGDSEPLQTFWYSVDSQNTYYDFSISRVTANPRALLQRTKIYTIRAGTSLVGNIYDNHIDSKLLDENELLRIVIGCTNKSLAKINRVIRTKKGDYEYEEF